MSLSFYNQKKIFDKCTRVVTLKKYTEGKIIQRIKAARSRKGYTQEQFAEVMHIPKSTVSAYENDKVDMKGSVLVELSEHLDTTPNYLLGVENTVRTRGGNKHKIFSYNLWGDLR